MPTDETQSVNASEEQTAKAPLAPPEITEDAIKAHPLYQGLEEKYAAARKGMDEANIEKKKKTTSPEVKSTSSLDEEEVDFRIQHIDELKVYGSTYKELRSKGYDRSDALELAKLKHQKSTTQSAEAQAANSSPSPVANRSISSDVITDQDQQDMQTWGFSKETLIAHKKLKQQRSGK